MRPDVAETAFRVMQEATGQAPKTVPGKKAKNPEAVERGSRGGLKGGRSRAARPPEERSKDASTAAKLRWGRNDS
jgi:hypothetical protein